MPSQSKYQHTYTSFAGVDIVATITPPGSKSIVIGSIQTISYSIHREKVPVRPLGHVNPKGFTYGGRTIAGSLIFTVFDRHVIKGIFEEMFFSRDDKGNLKETNDRYSGLSTIWRQSMYKKMLIDEMPPFDVNIIMNNEMGQGADLTIMGVTIVDEGQVMSIEDMITENTMSFMAHDIRLMEPFKGNLAYTPNENSYTPHDGLYPSTWPSDPFSEE